MRASISVREDGRVANRAGDPDAFLRSKQGEGYIALVNNKRRSRAMCWKGGAFGGGGGGNGEWVRERPKHMKDHFAEAKSPIKNPPPKGEGAPTLPTSQPEPNSGKSAMVEEPISSPATSGAATSATECPTGIAEAASPDVPTGKKDPEKTGDAQTTLHPPPKTDGR